MLPHGSPPFSTIGKRLIYLVDGYDEVVHSNNSTMFDNFIKKILDSVSTLIMTSRPISSSQSLLNRFDVIAEIQPFEINECLLFVGQYFGHSRDILDSLWFGTFDFRLHYRPLLIVIRYFWYGVLLLSLFAELQRRMKSSVAFR
jgi:hypothetical protein